MLFGSDRGRDSGLERLSACLRQGDVAFCEGWQKRRKGEPDEVGFDYLDLLVGLFQRQI